MSAMAGPSRAVVSSVRSLHTPRLQALPVQPTHVHLPLSYLHPSTKPTKELISSSERLLVPLSSSIFDLHPPRNDILHACVVHHLDSLRAGTGSTKTRAEVAGSGRKVRPQKGTGRARMGQITSGINRGGGVIHGPKPRDFATSLNKKVRLAGLRYALSSKWRQGQLAVVPNLALPSHKTQELYKLLRVKGWDDALFVTAPRTEEDGMTMEQASHEETLRNFVLATGNLQDVELVELVEEELIVYDVLRRNRLILDLGALERLEEKLSPREEEEDVSVRRSVGLSVDEAATAGEASPGAV